MYSFSSIAANNRLSILSPSFSVEITRNKINRTARRFNELFARRQTYIRSANEPIRSSIYQMNIHARFCTIHTARNSSHSSSKIRTPWMIDNDREDRWHQPVSIMTEKFVSNRAPLEASALFPPLPWPHFPRQLASWGSRQLLRQVAVVKDGRCSRLRKQGLTDDWAEGFLASSMLPLGLITGITRVIKVISS